MERCPDKSDLKRLMLGQLPADRAQSLEEHLPQCPRCSGTIETIQADDTLAEAVRAQASLPPAAEEPAIGALIDRLCRLPDSLSKTPTEPRVSLILDQLGPFLDPPEAPGEIGRFGRYRIQRVLGSGGMGVVLQAVDPQLERTVAIKVLKPALAEVENSRRRFLREARAAASIECEHVVTIYEVGEHRGLPYLAMPLLSGETLGDRLRREGPLPLPTLLAIAEQIAAALAVAHDKGIVHRDVKPDNIFLEDRNDDEQSVTILDFGLARVADEDSTLTAAGMLAGTPAYMAPEQAGGGPVDHRADLFGLGCLLYQMCTGKAPFLGDGAAATVAAVLQHHPPPPAEVAENVPPWLSDLVMRLLEKDPRHRVESARQVVESLSRQSAPGPRAGASRRRWPPSRIVVLALAAAALVVLAGTIVYVRYNRTGEGTLVLEVNQPDVKVTVDGNHVEIDSPRDEIEVTVGKHDLEVAKDGFITHTESFEVTRNGKTEITAKLVRLDTKSGTPDKIVSKAPPLLDGMPVKPAAARVAELRRFEAHKGAVNDVAISEDSRLAASGGEDGTVRIWEIETGRTVHVLKGHEGAVGSVEFTPDDRHVVSGGSDKRVRIWDLKNGREIFQDQRHTDIVTCVAVSVDGKRAVSGSFDKKVCVWDLEEPKWLRTMEGHTSWVRGVDFAPDNRHAMSAGNDGMMIFWDTDTGEARDIVTGHRHVVACVEFSRLGGFIISGSWDETVRLWNWNTRAWQEIREFLGHKGAVRGTTLSRDNRFLLTGGEDKIGRLWEASNARLLAVLEGHSATILAVAISPDGRFALTCSEDGTVRVWPMPDVEKKPADVPVP